MSLVDGQRSLVENRRLSEYLTILQPLTGPKPFKILKDGDFVKLAQGMQPVWCL